MSMSVLERVDLRLGNMKMMLERLGIDPVAFASQAHGRFLASAMPACQGCACDEACHEWLTLIGPKTRLEQAPAFCPNAQLFVWAKEELWGSELH